MAKKHTEKYDPEDVPLLLKLAKGQDHTDEADRVTIIAIKNKRGSLKSLTQLEARDELEMRFRRIVATLVNVCITGRPNYWSSYQKTFLKMFASRDKPIQDTACKLKTLLSKYEKEELFSTGQLAVLLAIDRCETNFASTIVICFKDLIHKMIKDPNNNPGVELSEFEPAKHNLEADVSFSIFLDSLDNEELDYVDRLMAGEDTNKNDPVLGSIKEKMFIYLGVDS